MFSPHSEKAVSLADIATKQIYVWMERTREDCNHPSIVYEVGLSVLSVMLCCCVPLLGSTAALPAGGITAERLFHMMRDQSMTLLVMDARSGRDFEDSQIQVPSQTCISVPEEAISPG